MSMADDDRTTLWISDDLWKELNSRKHRGDTFEDVIWRELDDDRDKGDDQEVVEADGSGERTYKAGEMVMRDAPDGS